jgi:hypothetical protein
LATQAALCAWGANGYVALQYLRHMATTRRGYWSLGAVKQASCAARKTRIFASIYRPRSGVQMR